MTQEENTTVYFCVYTTLSYQPNCCASESLLACAREEGRTQEDKMALRSRAFLLPSVCCLQSRQQQQPSLDGARATRSKLSSSNSSSSRPHGVAGLCLLLAATTSPPLPCPPSPRPPSRSNDVTVRGPITRGTFLVRRPYNNHIF